MLPDNLKKATGQIQKQRRKLNQRKNITMCSNFFKESKWVLFLESVKKIAVIVQYIVQYAYKMHDFF